MVQIFKKNMNFNFKNRTVIVTGGEGGIGQSISEKFIKFGANVIITTRNKNKLNRKSKKNHFVYLDFNDENSVNDFLYNIKKLKKIDILINNAGITGPTTELWNYNNDEWNKIIKINLHGTFYCCKTIVPYMLKQKYGRIVNIASVSGKDGNANASAYSSAKAGVIGLTKSLGKELATYNIAVNAVTPAGAKTRILNQMSKEHVQRMLSKVPRGRFLEVEELSSLICWLSSEENSFSTASVFDISGGRSTY